MQSFKKRFFYLSYSQGERILRKKHHHGHPHVNHPGQHYKYLVYDCLPLAETHSEHHCPKHRYQCVICYDVQNHQNNVLRDNCKGVIIVQISTKVLHMQAAVTNITCNHSNRQAINHIMEFELFLQSSILTALHYVDYNCSAVQNNSHVVVLEIVIASSCLKDRFYWNGWTKNIKMLNGGIAIVLKTIAMQFREVQWFSDGFNARSNKIRFCMRDGLILRDLAEVRHLLKRFVGHLRKIVFLKVVPRHHHHRN